MKSERRQAVRQTQRRNEETGDIWWATLPAATASEPGYRRPVAIVQSDAFNRSRINTIICVVLTSNLKLAKAPGAVSLPARAAGLSKASVANVSQVITVDRVFLTEFVTQLPSKYLRQIEEGLQLVLNL